MCNFPLVPPNERWLSTPCSAWKCYYRPDAGSAWVCNYQDKGIIWGVQPGWALLMINSAIIRQDHECEPNEGDSGPKYCQAQPGCSRPLLEVLSGVSTATSVNSE